MSRVLAMGVQTARSRAPRIAIHLCAVLLTVACGVGARAQGTSRPAQFDPYQAQKNLEAIQQERRLGRSSAVRLPSGPKTEISADRTPLVRLTGIVIEGAHVIAPEAIGATYQPYIGKTVSKADLTAITKAISDLYREAGFHLSRAIVPPQDLNSGRIRVQVIEGTIADIVIKGDDAERFGARALLAGLTTEQPARLATLERQLLLVNDLPGVRITDTAIEEIGKLSGRFRLVVSLSTWQVYSVFGLDRFGTPAVGPLESYWTSSLNSFLRPGDTLGVNLSTVPNTPKELDYGRLAYDTPVGASGARLGIAGAYGDVRPGDDRQQFGTLTHTTSVDVRGSIVPLLSRDASLALSATGSFGDVSEHDDLGTIYSDHIRTVRVAADLQRQDDLRGKNYLTLGVRQGFDVLGASHNDDPFLSRFGGTAFATIFDFAFTRYQKLNDAWSIKLATAGQLTSSTLLQSQEYYLGGPAFGRAYYGGEVSGDNGIAALVELRFDQALNHELAKGYQLYGFLDRGIVWNVHDFADKLVLSSAGGGVRVHLVGELDADVGVAVPLDFRSIENPSRHVHAYFALSHAFKLCPDKTRIFCS
jgi:hemolysin activation/secretion protein